MGFERCVLKQMLHIPPYFKWSRLEKIINSAVIDIKCNISRRFIFNA